MATKTTLSTRIGRKQIRIIGTVQGIGFRPFVHRLAFDLRLSGFINNDSCGVNIEIEGSEESLRDFISRLPAEAPPLAVIEQIDISDLPTRDEREFRIAASKRASSAQACIPPDIAICSDCVRELFDKDDFRYRYPFINCTNCGPRFTIVGNLPYDRPLTTMKEFAMCDRCAKEYENPSDRRFHAQPIACPSCGPQLQVVRDKKIVTDADPVQVAIESLKAGEIVALRGLGGFHLAVDATNQEAVERLRLRKRRPLRPFALMVDSLEKAQELCEIDEHERGLLVDPRAPIVLMRKKDATVIASSVSPDSDHYGVMLCYTPLHYLLIRDQFPALVMTSGNISDEPIAIGNEEAVERLDGIADLFLWHNREILQRADDSIVARYGSQSVVIRRARGFVPAPISVSSAGNASILACGADLKNAPGILRGGNVYLGQHVGDLDHPMALDFYEHVVSHLKTIMEVDPSLIVCDRHPEYRSTAWASKQSDRRVIAVQHHHAHLVSVMADNNVSEPIIGVILDGTGYGLDHTIWGGEILVGDTSGFDRAAHFEPVPIPGGQAAINEPWRMAAGYLYHTQIPFDRWPGYLQVDQDKLSLVNQMLTKKINSPLTSSCGRLFDAVAGLLNLTEKVEYEAQAAIQLENLANRATPQADLSSVAIGDDTTVSPIPTCELIRSVLKEIDSGESSALIAYNFHRRLAECLVKTVRLISADTRLNRVGLSGGVWQNRLLFSLVYDRLFAEGYELLTHKQVPCNDGGLALGQAVIAARQIADETGNRAQEN